MYFKPKTRKRLTILLATLILIGLAGAGAYVWRVRRIENTIVQDRREGLACFQTGDDAGALDHLGRYLRRRPEDTDVLYKYAKVRLRVREARSAHLSQALSILRQVVAKQPGNMDASHDLLDLYVRVGMGSEALELSDRLLALDAQDISAMRVKATVLLHLRRFDEASVAVQRCLEKDPLDLEVQLERFAILQNRNLPAGEIVREAEALAATHPEDPRAELIAAMAHSYNQNQAAASTWAQRAMSRTTTDAKLVERVARFADQLGLTAQATRYLDQNSALAAGRPELQRLYMRRLWQQGQIARIVEQGRSLDAQQTATDGDLLGLYAVSLLRSNQRTQMEPVMQAMRARPWDDASLAWIAVLDRFMSEGGDNSPAELVKACRQAISYAPDQEVFRYFLGEAYYALGEPELALESWRETVQASPGWLEPRLRVAQTLLETGRASQAFAVAQDALRMAPTSVAVAILMADTWSTTAQEQHQLTGASLLKLIEMVQQARPGEPRTLMVRAAIMAEQGNPEEAGRCVRQLLDANASLDQSLLLRAAALCRTHQLGLENACYERERSLRGVSASLGQAQATAAMVPTNGDAAVQAFDKLIPPGKQSDLDWRVARAQVLESAKSLMALAAWTALADGEANDTRVQHMALASAVVWTDAALVDRIIDRLKLLTGDEGVRWRLARARRLLNDETSRGGAIEAARLLADVARRSAGLVECHMLLAEAYRRLDNPASAVENLTTAVNLRPEAVAPRLMLAEMQRIQGAAADAGRSIDAVLASPLATEQERSRAIALLAMLGQQDRALSLLQNLHHGDVLPPELLAAQIYLQRGKLDEAQAIARKLMEKPTAQAIQFAANLAATRGKMDEAHALLDRLPETGLASADQALIRAEFLARYDSLDAAIAATKQATQAAPDRAQPWLALIRLNILAGRGPEVAATATEAQGRVPADPALTLLYERRDMMAALASQEAARALLLVLCDDAKQRDAAVAALELMRRFIDNKEPLASAAFQLRALADRNPQLLPLQNILAQMYLQLGRFDDAIAVASRAMQARSDDVDSAALTAKALAAARRWSEALSTAREWRGRAGKALAEPDRLIASCLLELNNPEEALRQLEPYAADFTKADQAAKQALPAYAQALIAAGRVEAARQLLAPMLESSPAVRNLWMDLAARRIADHAAAAAWLTEIQQKLSDERIEEKLTLGRAWRALGERCNVAKYSDQGYDLVGELMRRPTLSGAVAVVYGIMSSERGDDAAAEKAYRSALAAEPANAAARNNLALLLLKREGAGAEAAGLARDNVQRHPQAATLLDTLGMVCAHNAEYPQAVDALQRAVKIEPQVPTWRVNLAWVLARAGRTDEAWQTLRALSPQTVTELSSQPDVKDHLREAMELTASLSGGQQSRLP